jgi:hypothetical protein
MPRSAVLLLSVLYVCTFRVLQAQEVSAGAGIGYGRDAWRLDIHSQLEVPVGTRLRLAVGARLTQYGGSKRSMKRQGLADGDFPESLTLDPDVWGLNLMLAVEARVTGPISAGANLDVVGVAGGRDYTRDNIVITPTRFSMFRYGNADRGSLNSEFYLAAHITQRLTVRGGLSHFVVGYKAVQEDQVRRYLRFDDAVFVAGRWRLGAS